MRCAILYATMLMCLLNSAYAAGIKQQMLLSTESMENGTASSLGIYAAADDFIFYSGLSLSYIHSTKVIHRNNRKTIFPIYLFVGLKAPWKLSPYIEAAVDLPEAIIDDLFNSGGEVEGQVDYYYSAGLTFAATDRFSFLLYAKKYNFKYRETFFSPTYRVRPRSYGAGVLMRF